MKSLLQIDLESKAISKHLYSIKRNSIKIYPYAKPAQFNQINSNDIDQDSFRDNLKNDKPTEYSFDKICFSYQDINEAILYDMVMQHLKQKSQNTQTITLIFDQVCQSQILYNFTEQLQKIDMFKKQKISIAHFLLHNGNGLFDYHAFNSKKLDTDREQIVAQKQGEQSFMFNFHKQLNLFEEIKPYQVTKILQIVKYVNITDFIFQKQNKVQKQDDSSKRALKQIQNRKNSEFYVVKVGEKLLLQFICFNFNKNYALPQQQKKDMNSIYTLYGSDTPQIKYKTVKTQMISKFINHCTKIYYIAYFPGPSAQSLSIVYPAIRTSSKNSQQPKPTDLKRFNSSLYDSNSYAGLKNGEPKSLFQQYSAKQTMQQSSSNLSYLQSIQSNSPSKDIGSKINKKYSVKKIVTEYFNSIFNNYQLIKNQNKQEAQNIIKQYMQKKQQILKAQLQRVNQSVKQLKIAHRVQQCLVAELKQKSIRSLQKMSSSIKQLQKMGIKNIGKHISWLQMTIQEKKNQIKDQQQQIEKINLKIIENQHNHEYFVKKMKQFRDRLIYRKKSMKTTKMEDQTVNPQEIVKIQAQNPMKIEAKLKNISINYQINHQVINPKLTQSQQQTLELYKQGLKAKMNERLRVCTQKKQFMERLTELKPQTSKIQFSRLQQKYFDFIID